MFPAKRIIEYTINIIDINIINSRCAVITVDNKKYGTNILKITYQ